jgi:hypothetical protein
MYEYDAHTGVRLTEESIALGEEHVPEFAERGGPG